MNTVDALEYAENQLKHHNLDGWKIVYDEARSRFGHCRRFQKQISLSYPLTLLNEFEEVKKVILHEIAHALTPGAHHNWLWKAKLREIGGDGKRCYGEEVNSIQKPYQYVCKSCGPISIFRFKLSNRKYMHPKCGRSLTLKRRIVKEIVA